MLTESSRVPEASLGYAFVNLVDSSYVPQIQEKLTGAWSFSLVGCG